MAQVLAQSPLPQIPCATPPILTRVSTQPPTVVMVLTLSRDCVLLLTLLLPVPWLPVWHRHCDIRCYASSAEVQVGMTVKHNCICCAIAGGRMGCGGQPACYTPRNSRTPAPAPSALWRWTSTTPEMLHSATLADGRAATANATQKIPH